VKAIIGYHAGILKLTAALASVPPVYPAGTARLQGQVFAVVPDCTLKVQTVAMRRETRRERCSIGAQDPAPFSQRQIFVHAAKTATQTTAARSDLAIAKKANPNGNRPGVAKSAFIGSVPDSLELRQSAEPITAF